MKINSNAKYIKEEYLLKRYKKDKLNTHQIAKECSCDPSTIRYWLIKFNILRRSCGEANRLVNSNHCVLSKKAKQWIDGELFGDGCLQSRRRPSAFFQYSSKYKEYINYISDTLKSFGINYGREIKKRNFKDWGCSTYEYRSLSYAELLPIRKRWYPKGKKIIPRDLELTPLVLRQEHIGDGSLEHVKIGRPRIRLATCGFPVNDVEWLVGQLNKLGFKSTRQKCNNTIYISPYSTKEFLDYIGKSPTKCYEYKFDYYKKTEKNRR